LHTILDKASERDDFDSSVVQAGWVYHLQIGAAARIDALELSPLAKDRKRLIYRPVRFVSNEKLTAIFSLRRSRESFLRFGFVLPPVCDMLGSRLDQW
jgi:hypothetical protein